MCCGLMALKASIAGGLPYVSEVSADYSNVMEQLVRYCVDEYNDHNYSAALKLCGAYEDYYNPKAHAVLGDIYYRGLGTAVNKDLAIRYYQRALAEGMFSTAPKLAYAYLYDPDIKHNEELALSYLAIAEYNHVKEAVPISISYRYRKNPQALDKTAKNDFKIMTGLAEGKPDDECYVKYNYLLGLFYLTGYGTPVDYHKAVEILQRLDRDYKYPPAQLQLAKLYYDGSGVGKNWSKALNYLEQITDEKSIPDAEHYYYMAMLYKQGSPEIKADEARAIDLLRKAANADNTKAALELARIYYGKTAKDGVYYRDAIAWCDRAIALDDSEGHYLKAKFILDSGFEYDEYADAIVELKNAVEHKVCKAYDLLGDLSLKNNTADKALHYYRQAHSCGKTERYGVMARILLSENSDNFNYNDFLEYINLGMNHNDSDAYYASGVYHLSPKNNNFTIALADLTRAATMGNADAMYKLYEIYIGDKYSGKNVGLAIKFLNQAANHGSKEALNRKFSYYLNGIYVKSDPGAALEAAEEMVKTDKVKGNILKAKWFLHNREPGKAVECYQTAADAGSGEALFALGMLYHGNPNIEQDLFKACNYFYQAERRGYAEAANHLANCIFDIHNGEIKEAIPYLEKAALNGNEEALEKLINIYSNEDDPFHNNNELLRWIKVGAKFGFPNSLYLLGFSYLYGIDETLNINEELGKKYLKLAISKGSTSAAFELAKYYSEHNLNHEACDIYEKFAGSSDYKFMQNLALCYLNGQGRKTNIVTGENLLLKAYEKTHSEETAFLLGEMYSDEDIGLYELKKAVEWYTEAVDGGSVAALEKLGELYARKSPIQNLYKSFFYYTKAMEAGSSSAFTRVAIDYYLGIGTPVDYKKGCDIAQEAVELAVPEANSILADCYLYGNGREKSFDRAAALLHNGVDRNDPESALKLGKIYSKGEFVDPDIDFACKYFYKAIIRDKYHGSITQEAVKYFIDGNICYKDSLHAYVIFNVLQNQNVNTNIKYHNEIARLVKLLTDRELKFAHQIISQMRDYDEQQ